MMNARKLVIAAAALAVTAALAGCGVKPAHLSPPKGADKNAYPHVYPDPATDPQPAKPQQ